MTVITDQKKMELLKIARRQLAEEYNLQRNDDYKLWLGNCEMVWRTSGNRLPLTPPPPLPTESEIVVRALRLYNEMLAQATPTPVQPSKLATVKSSPDPIIAPAVVATMAPLFAAPAIAPVVALPPEPVVETIVEPVVDTIAAPVVEPIAAPVVEPKAAPAITKTEYFADSIYDAPAVAVPAMIEKIVPDVVTTKSAATYTSGIYKIYQTPAEPSTTTDTVVAVPTLAEKLAIAEKQKPTKTDSLKNRLIGIFPQWNHQ